jgi:hypothetical protein
MVNSLTPPGLEGLFDLDRRGVDIRPTLLRVLTDQYLRSPAHTLEEEQRYTELAMRLLDETDIATRAAVSARLAPHVFAPRRVILKLARDVLEVAEPVLSKSPVLTPVDCQAIIEERGTCYAAVLANRALPTRIEPPASFDPPARSTEPQLPPMQSMTGATNGILSAGPVDAEIAGAAQSASKSATWAEANELCELFFSPDSDERKLILLNLDYSLWPAEPAPSPPLRADIWRLETAALMHNTSSVIRELERALGITNQQARRIVEDDLGEPLVVASKAMCLPADVLQRILLFMHPRVGRSVDRVYELAALYNEISLQAAQRLISIMRSADAADRQAPPDPRALHSALEIARGSSSHAARPPAKRSETLNPQRPAARG